MNITYIIGVVLAFVVFLLGIVTNISIRDGFSFSMDFDNLVNFVDIASVFIVIGCTFAIVIASFGPMLGSIPKHFQVILNTKKFNPHYYIDQLTELAQIARKNGLLALEERANEQKDPFFKQAIMLIVDANDPDRVRAILENDIERTSARHDETAAMYEKAASISPAFGMVGTLVGLINMLYNMNLEAGGASTIGQDMGVALITTLYGVLLANIIFGPIASNLRARDEEEVVCKLIIVEGIMSIQSGENPKFLRERLLTYMKQSQRDVDGAGGKKKGKKGKGDDE